MIFQQVLFYLLSFLIIASALGVVIFPCAIKSTLCLIVTLIGVAAIFAMLNAHFLVATQVIVYAGAIVVLVLFVVMLLNLKKEKLRDLISFRSILGVILLTSLLLAFFPLVIKHFPSEEFQYVHGNAEDLGRLLFGKFLFAFEIASFLIIAALLGAIALAQGYKTSSLEKREAGSGSN